MAELFARVLPDLDVPHLDQTYDYRVPDALHREITVGQAVRVRFSGRLITGYVMELTERPAFSGKVAPLQRVVSSVPIFSASSLRTIEYLAERYCASRSQILSLVAPKRVAAVDRKLADTIAEARAEHTGVFATSNPNDRPLRRVVSCLPGEPSEVFARASLDAAESGGTLLVLLAAATQAQGAAESLAKDTGLRVGLIDNEQGPTRRYRSFVRALLGEFDVLVGTRSAVWTPLPGLQSILIWDDGDDRYQERRAPRFDALDVAVARSHVEGVELQAVAYARSVKDQALVASGWAQQVVPDHSSGRTRVPRLRSFDSFEAEREGPTGRMRLPDAAYRLIREALPSGPVLVQVPAAGYVTPGEDDRLVIGSDRIAEEIQKAFPEVPVRVSSSTAGILRQVEEGSQIVVSTPGAEPGVAGGYAGVVITGASGLPYSPSLNASLEACRRWMGALALGRDACPALLVGEVPRPLWDALVLWRPERLAAAELDQRVELGFPPARWTVVVEGAPGSVATMRHYAEDALGRAQFHLPGQPFSPLTLVSEEQPEPETSSVVLSCGPAAIQTLMSALGRGRRELSEQGRPLPRLNINPHTLAPLEG